jgi:hypothetical protein
MGTAGGWAAGLLVLAGLCGCLAATGAAGQQSSGGYVVAVILVVLALPFLLTATVQWMKKEAEENAQREAATATAQYLQELKAPSSQQSDQPEQPQPQRKRQWIQEE